MRIISGRFKGHQLVSFKASHIRPTTDRVKETIFNKLMSHVSGEVVWDLFSGTGNLGLEALSRGAEKVVFVEKQPKSIQILRQNIKKLGVEEEVEVVKRDVFSFLKDQLKPPKIVLIDPPFTQKIAHDVMEQVSQLLFSSDSTRIVIESSAQERIENRYNNLILLDRKSFGDKTLSIYTIQIK